MMDFALMVIALSIFLVAIDHVLRADDNKSDSNQAQPDTPVKHDYHVSHQGRATVYQLPNQGFVFGIPAPVPEIPGFQVIAREDEFLRAERNGEEYIVEDFPGHFILTPRCDGYLRDWYDFRRSFWVEKEGKSTSLVPYDPVFAAWNSGITEGIKK